MVQAQTKIQSAAAYEPIVATAAKPQTAMDELDAKIAEFNGLMSKVNNAFITSMQRTVTGTSGQMQDQHKKIMAIKQISEAYIESTKIPTSKDAKKLDDAKTEPDGKGAEGKNTSSIG